MKDAFFISWVGMGLVFVGLLALWGMMAAVVKLTNVKKPASLPDESLTSLPEKDLDLECKRKVAAASVAAAMALLNTSLTTSLHKDTENLSPWQTTHRSLLVSPTQILPRRKE